MPTSRRPGPGAPHLEASIADMRALAHPLRLRIIELFAEAPRTTKQVADLLGEPPTRLYHHVAALERAGLLRLTETRKNRGTVEKWYESISRSLASGPVGGGTEKRNPTRGTKPASRADRRAMGMTVLEQSRQEVMAAMSATASEPPLLARVVLAAPPSVMRAMRRRILEFIATVQREYACEEPPSEAAIERWAMTMMFAPVWPQPTGTPRRGARRAHEPRSAGPRPKTR